MIHVLMMFIKGFTFPSFEDFYKIITTGNGAFHYTYYKTYRGNYEYNIRRLYNRECIEISISNIHENSNNIYHDVLYLNVVSIKDKAAIKKWYKKQIKESNKVFKEYIIKKYFTEEEE